MCWYSSIYSFFPSGSPVREGVAVYCNGTARCKILRYTCTSCFQVSPSFSSKLYLFILIPHAPWRHTWQMFGKESTEKCSSWYTICIEMSQKALSCIWSWQCSSSVGILKQLFIECWCSIKWICCREDVKKQFNWTSGYRNDRWSCCRNGSAFQLLCQRIWFLWEIFFSGSVSLFSLRNVLLLF